jgi:antitoxin MazE
MSKAYVKIMQWGDGLGLRLTPAVVRAANLRANQCVRVSARPGQITIRPDRESELTLEKCLALFDPARHGGEVMAFEAIGREKSHDQGHTDQR